MGRISTFDFEGDYVTWTTDGAYAGTVFFRSGRFNCTNVCGTLKEKDEELDLRFLSYLLSSVAKNYVSYVGNPKLMNGVMGDIELYLPELKAEQSNIAEVLSTVDRAIEQTEALIAKYHRIKTGLMHDLLTRGIDEHDQLRDPATHKFKNSPLGMIPEEWTAAVLSSITDLQVGYAFKSRDFVDNGGILLLRGDNVGYGQPDWSNPKYLLQNPAKHLKEYFLRDGDIVIGMDRTFTKQGCKISVLRKQDSPALLVQRVGRFLPKANAVGFLNALLSSLDFQNNLQKQEKGMDIPHLSKDEILSVPVIIPTLREMNEIARIANCLNENLESEKLSLLKFYRLKTGLMQDLLTGKVSVEPLLEPQNEDR